jgi:hypothetical protein
VGGEADDRRLGMAQRPHVRHWIDGSRALGQIATVRPAGVRVGRRWSWGNRTATGPAAWSARVSAWARVSALRFTVKPLAFALRIAARLAAVGGLWLNVKPRRLPFALTKARKAGRSMRLRGPGRSPACAWRHRSAPGQACHGF